MDRNAMFGASMGLPLTGCVEREDHRAHFLARQHAIVLVLDRRQLANPDVRGEHMVDALLKVELGYERGDVVLEHLAEGQGIKVTKSAASLTRHQTSPRCLVTP